MHGREIEFVVVPKSSVHPAITSIRLQMESIMGASLARLQQLRELRDEHPRGLSADKLRQLATYLKQNNSDADTSAKLDLVWLLFFLTRARDLLCESATASLDYLTDKVGQIYNRAAVDLKRRPEYLALIQQLERFARASDPASARRIESVSNTNAEAGDVGAVTEDETLLMMMQNRKLDFLCRRIAEHMRKGKQREEWMQGDEADADDDGNDNDNNAADADEEDMPLTELRIQGNKHVSTSIVFVEKRKDAEVIATALNRVPGICAEKFVGQSGDNGMQQEEQGAVLKRFREGKINCL